MILILDNLRSAYNVGALFRSADGAGVTHVYLVGITPAPAKAGQLYRTLAEKTLAKTALGAEASVPWTAVKSCARLAARLRADGYDLIALEESEGVATTDYRDWRPSKGKMPALIVGNEVEGLSQKTLALADVIIRLPMRGMKRSLNVSVAGSIALYHLSATMEKEKKISRG
jgi:tRNA G18 (ribose-2'-O)-methylase SpoU